MKKKRAKEVYTLADLRKWESIDPPVRLGVFGDPVAHSLSPQMQNAALKRCKIDMQYARFQISPDELQSALDLIRELNFVGVNLTTPHKIAASKLMDEIDDNVRRIGAINTVRSITQSFAATIPMAKDSPAPFGRNSRSICAI